MPIPKFQEVRIENTNACGYRCAMCPREKQTRKIGYMPMADLDLTLKRLGEFQGEFHLHGFGEPLLDRSLPEKVKQVKKNFPASPVGIFSTLGVKLPEEKIQNLVISGLDFICVSLYGFSTESYAKIHGFMGLEIVKTNLKFLQTAIQTNQSPLQIIVKIPAPQVTSGLPMLDLSESQAFTQWIHELGFQITYWAQVHNYGNGRSYNTPDSERLCPVLYGQRKKILHVTWDLNVIPCCYDFNTSIPFGNLRTQTLDEIFSSPEYLRFTLAHASKELSNYPICQTCEKIDYI